MGVPPQLVGLFHGKSPSKKDDDWGYPYFRTPPYPLMEYDGIWFLLEQVNLAGVWPRSEIHFFITATPMSREASVWNSLLPLQKIWLSIEALEEFDQEFIVNIMGARIQDQSFTDSQPPAIGYLATPAFAGDLSEDLEPLGLPGSRPSRKWMELGGAQPLQFGGFLSHGGTPSHHLFFWEMFPEINYPANVVPPFF